MNQMQSCPFRLSGLSLAAKLTLTLFLILVCAGYAVALIKIYWWHELADNEPGLTINDIRAVYHGIESTQIDDSEMLKEVSPGGQMRIFLEAGGESAERALIGWLEAGAQEATFTTAGLTGAGDPSASAVIQQQCVKCHNQTEGDNTELPFAAAPAAAPQYDLVAAVAVPPGEPGIQPESKRELLQVTHAHILSIPVFTIIIAILFLLTNVSDKIKLVLAPLPMLATCIDFACWWLARPFEVFIYGIAFSGALFGTALGLQLLCILLSLWFGKKPASAQSSG
jgi:hypothetical protein